MTRRATRANDCDALSYFSTTADNTASDVVVSCPEYAIGQLGTTLAPARAEVRDRAEAEGFNFKEWRSLVCKWWWKHRCASYSGVSGIIPHVLQQVGGVVFVVHPCFSHK